jgi:glutamate transport system permease protein
MLSLREIGWTIRLSRSFSPSWRINFETAQAVPTFARPYQAMQYVVLPQALRCMLPALISSVLAIVQDTSLGYVIPYDELLHRSQDVSSYAPQSLLQAAFIVTMMYGMVSAALLYLKRWVTRRQGRVVVRSTAVSGVCTSVCQATEVGKASVAGVLPTE